MYFSIVEHGYLFNKDISDGFDNLKHIYLYYYYYFFFTSSIIITIIQQVCRKKIPLKPKMKMKTKMKKINFPNKIFLVYNSLSLSLVFLLYLPVEIIIFIIDHLLRISVGCGMRHNSKMLKEKLR